MFYNFQDKLRRLRFYLSVRQVFSTAPIGVDQYSPIALMTQLQHKDVLLAIIAFKSFVARIPVNAFYVLNDGSLTPSDFYLLRHHFPGLTFLRMEDAKSEFCPTGGCWERLLSISSLIRNHYVIQLDSDTLTLGDIPEISACVKANQSFVIGTWDGQDFESMLSRQATAAGLATKAEKPPHIQLTSEASFNSLDRFQTLKDVRGCAGFSGFAQGSFDRSFVEAISAQMLKALGNRWREWGSEQVMSNIVVANSPSARVLPHPKYCDCTRINPKETVFIHFIGSCRFMGGTYARMAQQMIHRLMMAR